jgi:nitroimidazol reductase NimA-like FMN-containing flavoprotein (pyridoxamine 5'-phosphate oxidase superfamily)
MDTSLQSDLVTLGRYGHRGRYDFATIATILDEAMICHIGFIVEGQPIVLPTVYARRGRRLYVHGSALALWIQRLTVGVPLCLTVSILDALVLARSAFNHSLNCRSVVVIGKAKAVMGERERLDALRAIVEHVCPGRWSDVRQPSNAELKATLVLRVDITEASAKLRTGPPDDPKEDCGKGIWAGLVPVRTVRGNPIPDPALEPGIPLPEYLLDCSQP